LLPERVPLEGQPLEEQPVDIARSEAIERDLDAMIERRDLKRRQSEGEGAIEELWKESERRHAAQPREQRRWEWSRYYDGLASFHRERAAVCERRAEQLMQDEPKGETA
jgi:sRNA-binding protein